MSKRKETIELEDGLERMAREKGWYGCEEITIGFYNNGHGDEICDYILMDSKGIIRCYELKVTKQDLKSKAKKSWYGNFNYLVVSEELYDAINESKEDWSDYIPDGVGLMVGRKRYRYLDSSGKKHEIREFEITLKPKKRNLSESDQLLITQSMVRSMNNKIYKYKDANNLDKMKALKKESRRFEKLYQQSLDEKSKLYSTQCRLEYQIRHNTGIKVHLSEVAEMVNW